MAPLRYSAKFDPCLSLDCAPTPSTLVQSKERKGSNFAIWQPWAEAFVDIMALTMEENYSIDVKACVETLIEQKLEDEVIKSTGMIRKVDPRLRDSIFGLLCTPNRTHATYDPTLYNLRADTFIKYWNTTIAVWNISDLVSNTSHTKVRFEST